MRERLSDFFTSTSFNRAITIVILVNAVVIGLDVQCEVNAIQAPQFQRALDVIDNICLLVYIVEMALKLYCWRGDYFKDGWNVFDFIIVIVSIIPRLEFDAQIIRIFRIVRIVRTMRLFSTVKGLRNVLTALLKSIPTIASTLGLLVVVYFIYAVVGVQLYHDILPEQFGHLGSAMMSLFQYSTLDDWAVVCSQLMAVRPLAWIYMVSFVILTAFVIVNIILGIIVSALESSTVAEEKERDERNFEEEAERDRRNFENLNAQLAQMQTQLAAITAALNANAADAAKPQETDDPQGEGANP